MPRFKRQDEILQLAVREWKVRNTAASCLVLHERKRKEEKRTNEKGKSYEMDISSILVYVRW